MDASEIYSKRLNAKEVIFHKQGEFIFPIADGRIKTPWRRSRPENIHLDTAATNSRRKSPWFSWRIRSLFHHLTTRFRMPVEQLMTSGPCQETSYTAITLNPESSFARREKNLTLFHWNTLMYTELHIPTWMLCENAASMIIGISMGHETCLILEQVSLNFSSWKKNLQTDFCGPGGD